MFQRDAVQTIAGSSSHLLHLINEILDLSKIDAGRMDVVRAEFDLPALVQELAVMFQPLCDDKRLTLRIEGLDAGDALARRRRCGEAAPGADQSARQRRQVHGSGGGDVRLMRSTDGRWRFEVEDTGPASPHEIRDRVFEPFQQGAAAARRAAPGSGCRLPAATSS